MEAASAALSCLLAILVEVLVAVVAILVGCWDSLAAGPGRTDKKVNSGPKDL